MALTKRQLRKIAKDLLDREKELQNNESCSTDQRIGTIEKFIVEVEKRLDRNDS